MDYLKHLKELRRKLANHQTSLLVGSGFSKNVSLKFPTWNELLFDLTYELHKREIDDQYHQHKISKRQHGLSKRAFIKSKCEDIISKEGYLEIVSRYIKHQGLNESIVTYIEERTPYIEKRDTHYALITGNLREELSFENLSLHRKIIELPWNNIYTTNYDELLDICIDENQYSKLEEEIGLLETEISYLVKEIQSIDLRLNELSDTDKNQQETAAPNLPIDGIIVDKQTEPKSLQMNIRFDLYGQRGRFQAEKENKEQLIRDKEKALNGCFNVVKDATGLKLKRNKNIIKLHGSLRSQKQKNEFFFEFDGDHKTQYIISKEDYDSYREKHEAFTQLMRISLLQESFCLIGFSGVDPNFLAWISWVRDILHREALVSGNKKSYKIYMIDVELEPITPDKELFYENHSIIRLPIRSPEVRKVFNEDLKNEDSITDRKSAIVRLLNFLSNDDNVSPDIQFSDISIDKERNALWNAFPIFEPGKLLEHKLITSVLQQLKRIAGKVWIPNLNYAYTHNQSSLLSYTNQGTWMQFLEQNDELKQVIVYALKDYYIPIVNFLEPPVINILLSSPVSETETRKLLSRNAGLSLKAEDVQKINSQYDQLLILAYSFQFKELETQLNAWSPYGRTMIQKCGLYALFDHISAAVLLEKFIEEDRLMTGEEKLYAFEQLAYIKNSATWEKDKRLNRLIRNYENAGFRSIEDNLSFLQKQILGKANKPIPFGEKRYSISRSFQLSKHTKPEMALQYLMVLVESGFQLCLNTTYIVSPEDWYTIFSQGFEYYPYPFLFYSLQYSNEDFLKRIGQDYAYSESSVVKDELPKICCNLFIGFHDTPLNNKDHVLICLSKLIIAVDPMVWQDSFLNVWNYLVEKELAFDEIGKNRTSDFITNCLEYITDASILFLIINDCLNQALVGGRNQAISYLFYLNKNEYFKKLSNSALTLGSLIDVIDRVIETLNQENINNLFLLGNIYRLLSLNQISAIGLRLSSLDLAMIKNSRIWHILLYFLNKDNKDYIQAKQAIIAHPSMWHTGIKGRSVEAGLTEPIQIRRISFSSYNKDGIRWDDDDIRSLYKKLKEKLPGIKEMTEIDDRMFSFTDVLEEMTWFLNFYKEKLGVEDDFNSTLELTRILYDENRNYADLEEGLLSKDRTEVVGALAELSMTFYEDNLNMYLIGLVLSKVHLQNEPALEESLSYLTSWFSDREQTDQLATYHNQLLNILKIYKLHPLSDCDIAFVEEKLVRIAHILKDVDIKSELIDYWIEMGNTSYFNNTKQFVVFHR